jgi:predicted phage terminase large subunit-like protein
LIIVDDPLDIADAANLDKIYRVNELFDEVVVSRLNNPRTGKILIIMHRLHEHDLSGHVFEQNGWTRTVLPLIAVRTRAFDLGYREWTRQKGDLLRADAFSKRGIKRLQSNANFQLLWQQNPLKSSFVPIKRRHFGTFDEQPEVGTILSIDPSLVGGSDCSFNVIQAWCRDGDNYVLLDQWREQCGYARLRECCLKLIKKYRPVAILVERTGNGAALLDQLQHRPNMISLVPEGTKLDRFRQVSKLFYSGKVLLKEDARWREEFLEEVTHFPTASTDDQMDAATQALSWLREHPNLEKPAERALCAKAGSPLPINSSGIAQAPSIVCALNSKRAHNGPFIEPKVWVEYGDILSKRKA